MNTCDTCQYWKPTPENYYNYEEILRPTDPDTYQPMQVEFEVRLCQCPKKVRFERPPAADFASVVDGSNYRAELATGPKFGCIHHKK